MRVVTSSQPELIGTTMSEKRQHFLKEYDWIRTGLMFEPRGHDAMSGSILYPAVNPEHDMAVLFIEVSGCLPMCGHGTIGTVTVALEEGLVKPGIPGLLKMETPAGLVEARYQMDGDFVESVELTNIASFLHTHDIEVNITGLGDLKLDVSYGGNFYAIIEPQKNYPGLNDFTVDDIRRFSPLIREAVNDAMDFVHPENQTIRDVSHVMWAGDATKSTADMRNAVFYGDRGIDRSPCGTGTSARMAQLVSRGDLAIGQKFVHESIIGSLFTGHAISETTVRQFPAIIPTISGWARVTGHNTLSLDQRDPYAYGFLLV